MAAKRPKHPDKDLERLIQTVEAHDWTVTKRKKYYLAKCPCGLCMEIIRLTPSDPNYGRNKLNKMTKCERWEV